MSRLRRILLYGAGLLLTAALAALITGRYQLRAPYPQTSGTISLPGLEAPVTVYRDAEGIPHIYAENERDLFFAQGYIHAQDRFWQMEFWRHVGQGRVSEIVGEAGLDSDRFIRTVGWNRIGEETVTYYREEAPAFYAVLEAYSAGVNAYLEQNPTRFSINHTILALVNEPWEIEPWTPLNTVTWGIAMSHDLSGNYKDELREARLHQVLSEGQIAAVMPDYPADRPVIVPGDSSANRPAAAGRIDTGIDWTAAAGRLIGREPARGFIVGRDGMVGSNNWVIGGAHTPTGLPFLANDPHLGIQMPSIWYQIGLHAPGFNVMGFSFAGVPGVIVGHNDAMAWGVTNVGPDVQDLFIEKINPADPNQYEFQGEWRDMAVLQETIKVNGGDDIILTVRETHHGPIISEVLEQEQVLAMQWTALRPSRVLEAVVLLNQAADYRQFRHALSFWDVPGQNFVYGDVEGNIAYQSTGRVPIRVSGDGRRPVPGWTGEHEWTGFIPFEDMPAVLNPADGIIVTANNAVVDAGYPYFISHSWATGDRAQRILDLIEERLAADGEVTLEAIGEIQADSRSLMAEVFVPLLLDLPDDDPRVAEAQVLLGDWDFQLRRSSAAAAIYELTYVNLLNRTVGDDLGEELAEDVAEHRAYSRLFMRHLAARPEDPWWDDHATPDVENRDALLRQALIAAVDWLRENHGADPQDWRWGAVHQATFRSAPLGQSGIGPVESLVNRGPFPADGGEDIVNAMGWTWSEPAVVDWHPSMRMIVDLADFDRSLAIIPTGQSGHPGHPWYDNMIERYLDGRFHGWPYSRAAVTAAAVEMLVLEPVQK